MARYPIWTGSCVIEPRKYLFLMAAFCALPASKPTTTRPGYWVGSELPSLLAARAARAVPSFEQKIPMMLSDWTRLRTAWAAWSRRCPWAVRDHPLMMTALPAGRAVGSDIGRVARHLDVGLGVLALGGDQLDHLVPEALAAVGHRLAGRVLVEVDDRDRLRGGGRRDLVLDRPNIFSAASPAAL